MLMKLGILFNGAVGVILAVPIVRYILSPVIRERKPGYESWLSLARSASFRKARRAWRPIETPRESIGWGNREYSLLGASRGRREVPGLRDQLRASGMPGSLVPAVRPVHVPVPRRRLLFGWLARLRTSGARLFEYRYKVEQGNLLIQAGEMPTPALPPRSLINISTGRPPCA
jgi:menaquinol-cytochrome c reductase iron-sulfur subunit